MPAEGAESDVTAVVVLEAVHPPSRTTQPGRGGSPGREAPLDVTRQPCGIPRARRWAAPMRSIPGLVAEGWSPRAGRAGCAVR